MKKSYPVLSPIEYGTKADNVKRYEVGETIDLEEGETVQLKEFGAIGPAVEEAPETPTKVKK